MALIVLLIRMMDAMKVFDTVYVLTRGGPGTATYVASMYNYVLFFGNYQVGYAAAMSYIILIIVNVFAIALIFALSERRAKEEELAEEYEIERVAAADRRRRPFSSAEVRGCGAGDNHPGQGGSGTPPSF